MSMVHPQKNTTRPQLNFCDKVIVYDGMDDDTHTEVEIVRNFYNVKQII